MKRAVRIGKAILLVAVLIAVPVLAYWAGYRAGFRAQGPHYRYLGVKRGDGDPNTSGTRYELFDISKPGDAARLHAEEERLKASGASYFIEDAYVERSISPHPSTRWANARR